MFPGEPHVSFPWDQDLFVAASAWGDRRGGEACVRGGGIFPPGRFNLKQLYTSIVVILIQPMMKCNKTGNNLQEAYGLNSPAMSFWV